MTIKSPTNCEMLSQTIVGDGTLGILRRAKKAGLIGEIKPNLMLLQDSGIYIRQNLIDAVLRDVGELD